MTFTLEVPNTVEETLDILAGGDETVRPVGGGSGLALMMRYGFFVPTTLVSLHRLTRELSGVSAAPEGGLRIGATTTLRDIEDSPQVKETVPVLHQALRRLATIRLRNVAQIGGAIAHGAPQMDLPPVLLALDARVRLRSRRGERSIAANEVFLGYYETGVESDELVTEVVLPPLGEHRGTYRKITARSVDDWPLLGIAAVARFVAGALAQVTVAVGALGDHAQRVPSVEAALSGFHPTLDEIRDAAEEAADGLDYHEGGMASPAYQRQIVATNLRRALEDVLLGSPQPAGRQG